jgi:hypothetical protein
MQLLPQREHETVPNVRDTWSVLIRRIHGSSRGSLGLTRRACDTFFLGRANWRDKPIPLSGDCLDELRLLGIVLQDLPNFADRTPDAVVSIEKSPPAPNACDNFVARNRVPRMLDKQNQDFQGNTLELQHAIAAA